MHRSSTERPPLLLVNEPRRLLRGTLSDLAELVRYRELLRALIARELRSRYKGAALGWGWALVKPLVMLFVYGLAVGIFLGAGRTIPQFMLFIYSGLLAWTLFSTLVLTSIASVSSNGPLIARASFPRLLLPLAAAAAALVDFCLQASVLLVGYAVLRDVPDADALLWLPGSLFTIVAFGLGLGLLLSALNVFLRDIGFLTEVGLQVGFWLAPVLYSYGLVVKGAQDFGLAADVVTRLYMLNPLANAVIGFQRALWPAATSPEAQGSAFPGALDLRIAVCCLAGAVFCFVGMRVFVRLSGDFAQAV